MVGKKEKEKLATKIFLSECFSKILYKVNYSNKKANQMVLGIDLLKEDIKKDLLAITTLRLEESYTKILCEKDPQEVMQTRGTILFFKCIKKTCEDFFTKHYGFKVKINLSSLKQSFYTKNILKDTEIIFKIPFYIMVDSKSKMFRSVYSPVYSYPSKGFLEAILDNLVLEISNCVVYFSLSQLSSVSVVRQTLFRSKFLSLRNFERFKNNLTWQLFIKAYIQKPIDLYNNRYKIYVLRTSGICARTIYANRSKDILSLRKIPLLTISVLEIRDFFTSRIDETIYFVSKGFRYTLTSVLGQVIGLVWRGIIEGLKK
tara:strand:+ start:286 stop:1233 length:948 start_codon:yes stop_codon:yes gene_type:complete